MVTVRLDSVTVKWPVFTKIVHPTMLNGGCAHLCGLRIWLPVGYLPFRDSESGWWDEIPESSGFKRIPVFVVPSDRMSPENSICGLTKVLL